MSENLQPDPDRLPLEVEQQIDQLSDEFETAWKNGQAPRTEEYIVRVPDVGRSRLLEELLVVEFGLLWTADHSVDIEVYRKRFPNDRDVIDAALALHERRRRADCADASNQPSDRSDPELIGRFQIGRRGLM